MRAGRTLGCRVSLPLLCLLRGLSFAGPSVNVHVACDDRISLYPAAPFRLATLLHAWTIAQVGRGSSLTRQTGWARSANPHNSHTSNPPGAPEEASESRHQCRYRLASMAPCGTRPCSRKRHSAIANLRATATIMIRRIRPLCPAVRCTNQRVIALFGWCLSQSQAAWIMVPRTWPRPAREIPWDRSTSPLS